jgi:hypothetical protein
MLRQDVSETWRSTMSTLSRSPRCADLHAAGLKEADDPQCSRCVRATIATQRELDYADGLV